jgi:hypothetical protein
MDINQQAPERADVQEDISKETIDNKLSNANNSIELSDNSEIKVEAPIVKDPNLIKKIEFVLNIQEVPGKKITENYLKDLTSKLKEISNKYTYIQYNFKVITESNVEYSKMMGGGGGDSTFPYNVFEGLFDRLSQKKTTNNESIVPESNVEKDETTNVVPESKNKGIFERLFSYIPSVGTINTPTIDLSFTMPMDLENLVQDPITYDDEYDGVTHVLVTIYDKIETMGYIGGLAQLENWIKRKGRKVER